MNSTWSHRRLLWAYQIAALCLLFLTVSPFTAPFATCGLANGVVLPGLADGGDSFKDKIVDDDGVVPALIDVLPDIWLLPPADVAVTVAAPVQRTSLQPFPLRL